MKQVEVERKLTAILSADVVGYSRLMEADEEATVLSLNAYREVIDGLVTDHHGRVFGSAGDSVVAEFSSPVEAVRCAVEIQQDIEKLNGELTDDRRMYFRIGINLGDVMVEGDNLLGDGVNIAARLQGLAKPGGICISGTVFDQVKQKIILGYEYVGEQEVKNIAEPVRTYHVLTDPEAAGKVLGGEKTRMRGKRWVALAAIVIIAVAAVGVAVWLRPWVPATERASVSPAGVPTVAPPSRHFRVERPANLADADALTIYDRIRADMVAFYSRSGNPYAEDFHSWRRYNVTPYMSATHGRRYVNNYANPKADAYSRYEKAGTFLEGSILAKDSFEVTERGDVLTGPLFLMEKMQPGFSPEGRDWRYTMIMPDGSLFGTTNGENSRRVEFCAECHLAAGDDQDHLFFVPEKHRIRFLNAN